MKKIDQAKQDLTKIIELAGEIRQAYEQNGEGFKQAKQDYDTGYSGGGPVEDAWGNIKWVQGEYSHRIHLNLINQGEELITRLDEHFRDRTADLQEPIEFIRSTGIIAAKITMNSLTWYVSDVANETPTLEITLPWQPIFPKTYRMDQAEKLVERL